MSNLVTLQSVAADIHNHVKDLVDISKDKILLELYMVLRYDLSYKSLGVSIKKEKNLIKVTGAYKKFYKIHNLMLAIGFDPNLNNIYNYMGFEKFNLFIDEQKINYQTLDDYISGTDIDINDLKESINNLKSSSVSILESGQMVGIHLDDYIGLSIIPPIKAEPYYLTFKEFVFLCK